LNSDRSWQKRRSASTDRSRFDRSLIDEDLADITRSLSLETRASALSTFRISQDSCWSPNVWRRNPDAPSSARCQALPACGHALFPFSPRITDPRDVEIWLRRAQAAILTPKSPPRSFIDMPEETLKLLSPMNMSAFTKDTIVVRVEDPNAINLSFVDLPGIVAGSKNLSISITSRCRTDS
jgi:hypothetical protein